MTFRGGNAELAAAASLRLAPLDVPLNVEIEQVPFSHAVAKACRGWEGAQDDDEQHVRVRLAWAPQLTGCSEVDVRVQEDRLELSGAGVRASAELERGRSDCFLSQDFLENPIRLREEVLDPLVLTLITRQDRAPFHASAFVIDGVAILLAGHSGAGKSCLAHAADMAGFQVLSDDTVYLQTRPQCIVWGWPRAAHLLREDAPDDGGPIRIRNGKRKHVTPLRSARDGALKVNQVVLCILRHAGRVGLQRLAANEALARLSPLDPGFDLLPDLAMRAMTKLTRRGAWELALSEKPAEALGLLVQNLPQLRQTATS